VYPRAEVFASYFLFAPRASFRQDAAAAPASGAGASTLASKLLLSVKSEKRKFLPKEFAVSIGSIDNTAWTPLLPSAAEQREETAPTDAVSALSRLTDTAGFSTVAPRLQAVLGQMASPGGNVIDTLADNVIRLQDGFMDTLYGALGERGVDLSAKMTLKLNSDAVLQVEGDHPEKDVVNATLAESPELSAAFSEIASQSSALRDIHSLHSAVLQSAGIARYSAMNDKDAGYQLSLKGDMSHFYFSR
jgi:hypothetical protein